MYFQRKQYLSMHIFPSSDVCPLLVVFMTVCKNVRGVIMLQCGIFFQAWMSKKSEWLPKIEVQIPKSQ